MIRSTAILISVVLGTSVVDANDPLPRTQANLRLPPSLAGYRDWKGTAAHMVDTDLSWLCVALPPQELARRRENARKSFGPHSDRYVRVFANPGAAGTLHQPGTEPFAPGSIVAKEKMLDMDASEVEGVAFMIKHRAGEFAESAGWEFRYYPARADASYRACIECHRTGATRDYVFSRPKADQP